VGDTAGEKIDIVRTLTASKHRQQNRQDDQ
jgi:hypothetical protein